MKTLLHRTHFDILLQKRSPQRPRTTGLSPVSVGRLVQMCDTHDMTAPQCAADLLINTCYRHELITGELF